MNITMFSVPKELVVTWLRSAPPPMQTKQVTLPLGRKPPAHPGAYAAYPLPRTALDEELRTAIPCAQAALTMSPLTISSSLHLRGEIYYRL